MPSNIAYPLGGESLDFKHFYLQMHYDNPNIIQSWANLVLNVYYMKETIKYSYFFKDSTDKSGVRFYVTENYRPIEFDVLTVIMLFVNESRIKKFN